MGYYKIKEILHSGIDGIRYTPRTDNRYPLRINRVVEINEKEIKIGQPFYLKYILDENGNDYKKFKRTSYVVDWDFVFDNRIRIETYRTIYEFERIELESE